MRLPALLACLVLAATALFVVGVALERGSGHHDAVVTHEETGEEGHEGEAAASEQAELRPLGVDVESWPFVALAAAASVALAAAGWLRPHAVALLGLIAVALLAFAALDAREVVHQLDVDETGLAVLAAAVAALHLAAALVAVVLAMRARSPGAVGTMRA
jgi:hypothetical protein